MNFKNFLEDDLFFYLIILLVALVLYLVLKYLKIYEGNTSTGLTVDMNEGDDKGKIKANLDELNEFTKSLENSSNPSGDSTSGNVVINSF